MDTCLVFVFVCEYDFGLQPVLGLLDGSFFDACSMPVLPGCL